MIAMIPPPILPKEYWADLDASTFRIRNRTYIEDKVKVASEASMFRLIAVDVSVTPMDTSQRKRLNDCQPSLYPFSGILPPFLLFLELIFGSEIFYPSLLRIFI